MAAGTTLIILAIWTAAVSPILNGFERKKWGGHHPQANSLDATTTTAGEHLCCQMMMMMISRYPPGYFHRRTLLGIHMDVLDVSNAHHNVNNASERSQFWLSTGFLDARVCRKRQRLFGLSGCSSQQQQQQQQQQWWLQSWRSEQS
jgi:hypothetical protein